MNGLGVWSTAGMAAQACKALFHILGDTELVSVLSLSTEHSHSSRSSS